MRDLSMKITTSTTFRSLSRRLVTSGIFAALPVILPGTLLGQGASPSAYPSLLERPPFAPPSFYNRPAPPPPPVVAPVSPRSNLENEVVLTGLSQFPRGTFHVTLQDRSADGGPRYYTLQVGETAGRLRLESVLEGSPPSVRVREVGSGHQATISLAKGSLSSAVANVSATPGSSRVAASNNPAPPVPNPSINPRRRVVVPANNTNVGGNVVQTMTSGFLPNIGTGVVGALPGPSGGSGNLGYAPEEISGRGPAMVAPTIPDTTTPADQTSEIDETVRRRIVPRRRFITPAE